MKLNMKLGIFVCGAVFVLFTSCKTTGVATAGSLPKASVKGLLRAHANSEPQFRTLAAKIRISLVSDSSEKSISATMRMQKDSVIWISAPMGVVKALITPGECSFYNKLDNTYFEGDFAYLSQYLGMEVDFQKLQRILLGQVVMESENGKYFMEQQANYYVLSPKSPEPTYKVQFGLYPQTFRLAMQQLAQPELARAVKLNYKSYQKVQGQLIPEDIGAETLVEGEHSQVALSFRNVSLNENVRFPFSIPKGYTPISLEAHAE